MSNFEKVKEFHETFKHPVEKTPLKKVFTENTKLVNLRLALIDEEFKELQEAVKNHDIVEVGDALTDLLYVIYGAGHSFGIDLDKSFNIVHRSNMTKACQTEQDAKDTVADIIEKGVYKNPQYKKEGKYWIVYDATNGKILKSKYYTPANLQYLKD